MTKAQIAELVNERLPFPQHPDFIIFHVSRYYNELMYKTFRTDRSSFDLYTKDYEVTVLCDTTNDVYYSELPEVLVQIPGPGSGLRRVSTLKGEGIEFVPVTTKQWSVLRELEVTKIHGKRIRFIVNQAKVIYKGKRIRDVVGKKLIQSLVIPIEKYEDDDEIRIPVGLESSLIDAAVERILNLPPEDMVNDNNEKTR